MKQKLSLMVFALFCVLCMNAAKTTKTPKTDREYWAEQAYRLAAPVLEPMSRGMLSTEMQIEVSPSFDKRDVYGMLRQTHGRHFTMALSA